MLSLGSQPPCGVFPVSKYLILTLPSHIGSFRRQWWVIHQVPWGCTALLIFLKSYAMLWNLSKTSRICTDSAKNLYLNVFVFESSLCYCERQLSVKLNLDLFPDAVQDDLEAGVPAAAGRPRHRGLGLAPEEEGILDCGWVQGWSSCVETHEWFLIKCYLYFS